MTQTAAMRRLVDAISVLLSDPAQARAEPRRPPVYGHLGAALCDAGLQAGLNYKTVVAPRVDRVLAYWPLARSASSFLDKVERFGLADVLRWRNERKLAGITALTRTLVGLGLEDEAALRRWLERGNGYRLLALPGIGPKTVDYLTLLVGGQAIAVDRHLRRVLHAVGYVQLDYVGERAVLAEAANHLNLTPAQLDGAIWAASAANSRPS